ncbi:MAG TPA: Uma2 family endonuclease [Thermoanaerobaculia bacterium]|jgi:Uma2 family endonuclease|nr:Uma2 family endonuclease [Thermoanaerobaculia bacterium]
MAIRDTIRRKLTYEDYLLFPEDGLRHEILDGEHYVTSAPSRWHQTASANLTYFLVGFLRRNRLGQVFTAPFEVVLSEHDVVQPDLLFLSNERLGILTEKNVQGAPDLVIEILSDNTRRRDETVKRDRYEGFGVLEYWLVDPQRQTVRIYRRSDAGFGAALELSTAAGDVLTTPLLPCLEIPVGEIFDQAV